MKQAAPSPRNALLQARPENITSRTIIGSITCAADCSGVSCLSTTHVAEHSVGSEYDSADDASGRRGSSSWLSLELRPRRRSEVGHTDIRLNYKRSISATLIVILHLTYGHFVEQEFK